MLNRLINNATHVYLACGATDFRKQSASLSLLVMANFKIDPYQGSYAFIFCNKRRNAIKILRYENNGFILASKKVMNGMKFQWPKTQGEAKLITRQQVGWLFEGLQIEQKNAHIPIEIGGKSICY